ncbi:glycosyltransferase [Microcoleus sp. F10-B2]
MSLSDAVLWVKFRVFLERSIARLFQVNVDRYIVQTPTMKRDLIAWMRRRPRKSGDAPIDIMPFVDLTNVEIATNGSKLCWDFIYVADGSGHKNHRRLFEAFRLLAEEGHRPTLAITVSEDDFALLSALDELRSTFHLNIVNLGQLPHREVLARYRQARAVIFPSYAESFGIPLIEATKAGRPIIAGELDFVRDVCVPVETFDPLSEVSIARAIKRFLFGTADPIELQSSKQFVRSLIEMSAIES